eukprot:12922239-Prorocentrum_lima.AAC.1
MARDFPLCYNVEATDLFAAVEAIMGSQEPGRVPDQEVNHHLKKFKVNYKLKVNFRCNNGMLAKQSQSAHS